MDITAKHDKSNIGYLDEEKFKRELWHHKPLTDFWQIGKGIEARLNKLGLYDLYDVAHCNEETLKDEFGVNAVYLIDHSKGIEPCTIKDIKAYKPKSKSLSNSQILFEDYSYRKARLVLIEMIDYMCARVVKEKKVAGTIGVFIGYSKDKINPLSFTKKLDNHSNSFKKISTIILKDYDDKINKEVPIRKIGITFGNLGDRKCEQLDLFSNPKDESNDEKITDVMNKIKEKYGKNAILRGTSLMDGATQKERNKLIGGHNAE